MPTVEEVLSTAHRLLNEDDPRSVELAAQVVRRFPEQADAHFLLGVAALNILKKPGISRNHLATAFALNPTSSFYTTYLADKLVTALKVDTAVNLLSRFLKNQPDDVEGQSLYLFILNYLSGCSDQDLVNANAAFETRRAVAATVPTFSLSEKCSTQERLRIGYVSDEFSLHVLSNSIINVLRAHDRKRVETVGISVRPGNAKLAKTRQVRKDRVAAVCDLWIDLDGLSEEEQCTEIRGAECDILICLSGWAAVPRTLFRYRLAPLQIGYVNYVGPMAMPNLDYRISDPVLDPIDAPAIDGGETPIQLASGHQYWGTPGKVPDLNPPPFKDQGFVKFGAFNNLAKLRPETLLCYAKILLAVPGSRLLIKSQNLDNTFAQDEILRLFSAQGVDVDRLQLIGFVQDPLDNDRIKMGVDIALDSFPFTGGQTTIDTLACGIPVVCVTGATYIHRVGKSILTRLGLPELCAESPEQFVELATDLAFDQDRIARLRATLREKVAESNLSDAYRHAHELEAAYHEAWRRLVSGNGHRTSFWVTTDLTIQD